MDDVPVIYGIEDFQSRTLVAQAAECEKINFLVGTQSLRNINQVQLIEFDDDTGVVTKQHFEHSSGEVWGLASAPQTTDLIATIFCKTQNYHTNYGTSVWRLPLDSTSDNRTQGIAPLQHACDISQSSLDLEGKNSQVNSLCWAPEDDSRIVTAADNSLLLWDIGAAQGSQAKLISKSGLEGCSRGISHLGSVRWCPHQNACVVGATVGANVLAVDMRSGSIAWTLEGAHTPRARELDFNPNKQYCLGTCGDDGAVKFWDVRNPSEVLLERRDHSHWVWSVRFNPSYDQLVLSCSSDQRVVVCNVPSVASQPIDPHADEEAQNEAPEAKGEDDHTQAGVVRSCEDHAESVYSAEWSAADCWTFASVSFDGRVVISRVPKRFKYKHFM